MARKRRRLSGLTPVDVHSAFMDAHVECDNFASLESRNVCHKTIRNVERALRRRKPALAGRVRIHRER